MATYEHRQLIDSIAKLDTMPSDPDAYAEWIKAGAHLDLLRRNALQEELIIYASGDYSYVHDPRHYVAFTAWDWRNERITSISTDPQATTNYFQTDGNSLPFELSSAFFRPDVLLKYKSDTDKYVVDERDIRCRGAWELRGIDTNEAGQVHAYICYREEASI